MATGQPLRSVQTQVTVFVTLQPTGERDLGQIQANLAAALVTEALASGSTNYTVTAASSPGVGA